jgi:hypothetical protein
MVAADGFGEQVMTLAEAAGWLERRFGRRPNVASVWRWAARGIKGVRLATISLGRYRYTTASALERFIAETSQPNAGQARVAAPRAAVASAEDTTSFTKAEVEVATRRRQQEKAAALQYLQPHLSPGKRGRRGADRGGSRGGDGQSLQDSQPRTVHSDHGGAKS